MGDSNKILTSANAYLAVTNIAGTAGAQQQLQGLPLGTADGTATGTVAVKVMGTGTGGAFVGAEPTTTFASPVVMGANATNSIPSGAKGWQVSVTSGTATVNGTVGVPAGVTLSSSHTLASGFSVTTAAASSAVLAWET